MMRTPTAALVIVLVSACPGIDEPDGGPGEGEGEGEGEGAEDMELLGEPVAIAITPELAVGMALALRSDGRAAFVYVQDGTSTTECQLFGGATVIADNVAIVIVDEQLDGTFRTRILAEVPPVKAAGLDIAVDPVSDALVVAHMGGAPAAGVCESSDLVLAVESGDTFTTTTVAQNGSDGSGPCRDGKDPLCAEGDFVGRFPALALADGVLALAYTDNHFGFGETDIFESDLELVRGTGPGAIADILSINTETGAGYNTGTAITSDGRVVIGHQLIGNNIQDEGVYSEVEQEDGTFKERLLLANAEITSRIAVAAAEGQGIFLAFREDGTDQLIVMRSVDDGESFQAEIPERLSVTGASPHIAFLSDGTLVLAYGHCRDVDIGNPLCDTGEDGVRVSWRSPGETVFTKKTFTGDDEDLDGIAVDMAIVDDVITTLSFNASQSQATIHRMHKVAR